MDGDEGRWPARTTSAKMYVVKPDLRSSEMGSLLFFFFFFFSGEAHLEVFYLRHALYINMINDIYIIYIYIIYIYTYIHNYIYIHI